MSKLLKTLARVVVACVSWPFVLLGAAAYFVAACLTASWVFAGERLGDFVGDIDD